MTKATIKIENNTLTVSSTQFVKDIVVTNPHKEVLFYRIQELIGDEPFMQWEIIGGLTEADVDYIWASLDDDEVALARKAGIKSYNEFWASFGYDDEVVIA
jgi:hypothetical protein